ncbi:MAG: clan AA aspartic protease [Leptolyngbyaceae cyanobacterium RU_5_1]|nr:clan AA aspartic protease [Leptolyngbyaceae cyanobacterium RU_5_1]
MMLGVVNSICEATLRVVVGDPTNSQRQVVDAVIDTGFSGTLTLPLNIITSLGLVWKGRDRSTLGDGSTCVFDVYIAMIIWNGEFRTIDVNASETVPLIGMRLLYGYDVRIQAIEGGTVIVEVLNK